MSSKEEIELSELLELKPIIRYICEVETKNVEIPKIDNFRIPNFLCYAKHP